jgi:molybdate transport system ATP-binding protein
MSLIISLNLPRSQFNLQLQTTISTKGFTGIYGHSGSGKTSLLRTIAGLEKNLQTKISFNQTIWQDSEHYIATQQRKIAYIFQDARLFPHLTVLGNLEFAYQRRFNNDGPNIEKVCEWFGLKDLLSQSAQTLSGGEKQLVALARALLSSPQLILMDEPLGSLDKTNKEKILSRLENLRQKVSTPVIYVSHDIEEISRLCDHLIVLERGTISSEGALIDLSSQLNLAISHEENAAAIIEATVFKHDENYQLTELRTNENLPLFVTRMFVSIGNTVRIRIPARDISITLEAATDSSILNILPATIDAIENTDKAKLLVRLDIGGQHLLARLTKKSVDRLQLNGGKTIYAQIKTAALLTEHIETKV